MTVKINDIKAKQDVTFLICIASALLYGITSMSMAFINKAVVSAYKFNYPFFIMACQMIVSITVLELLRVMHFIKLSRYTISSGIALFWPALFYAIHSITSLYALSGMSIPMYTAIKRCTPVVTLILSVIILRKIVPSFAVTFSVLLTTFGCLIAGLGDLQFDLAAYVYGALSALVQGLYLTLTQKMADELSALQILQICNYTSLPAFIVLSLFHDWNGIKNYDGTADLGFIMCFLLQVSLGIVLNLSLFLCTIKNSALTTSLVGVMKSVAQTVIGSFVFGGISFTFLNVTGIILNTIGGLLYMLAKYREKRIMELQSRFQQTIKPV